MKRGISIAVICICIWVFLLYTACETATGSSSKEYLRSSPNTCFTSDANRNVQVIDYIVKNESILSQTDKKLLDFIAGSCLPIVLLSGLYGTKLQIYITDCNELNLYHPEIAKQCGFDKNCQWLRRYNLVKRDLLQH